MTLVFPHPSSIPETSLELEGLVERVTFHSPDTGYSVLRAQVKGHRNLVTVVGFAPSINPGEAISCIGEWIQNKDYGRQFQAKLIRALPPSTLDGIEKYLGSGMVKGIGPHFAKKLVMQFGIETFEVIENQPEKLKGVEGIGPKRISQITSAWNDQKVIRSIMVFLQSHGVSPNKAVRIFKIYGDAAIEKVRQNPYQLSRDVYGIGFKSADQIAEKLGIAKDSLIRARAGINHVLTTKIQEGHCAYLEAALLQEAAQLLDIQIQVLQMAVTHEVQEGFLVRSPIDNQTCLYPLTIYQCENEVAQAVQQLAHGKPPWGKLNEEEELREAHRNLRLELAPRQKEAVLAALQSKFTLITGGPGTGKSTLTRVILTILGTQSIRMMLCSPTGRAAKRLSECTGIEAKTIHRTLGFDPKKGRFLHHPEHLLPVDLLLVDEASMLDIPLAHSLLRATPLHAAVIFIGDVDQLPSVGPGKFLADLIQSRALRTVQLDQIFRQASESRIIQAAHSINQGRLPELGHQIHSDFYFIPSEVPEKTIAILLDLVRNRIPAKLGIDPVRDIQVLCPMQRGKLGARNLNLNLQKALNPHPPAQIERFGCVFAVNDKVMAIQNDYDKEVFNGDIGFLTRISEEEQQCAISFDDREVIFDWNELDILQPAYTITIHKSQGSEYPAVVIPIAMEHFTLLKKNLLYTGVTRGKRFVVLVGQQRALATALQSLHQIERLTNLSKKITEACTAPISTK